VSREVVDSPPPFLGSWKRVYIVVAVYLAVLIAAFWIFGRRWS